jgi:cell division protein FtsL
LKELRSRRKRKKSNSRAFLFITLIFALAVLWVWKSIEAHSLARELSSLESEKKQIAENNKRLMAERERLCSIDWIDNRARSYGLTYEVKNRLVLFDSPVNDKKASKNVLASAFDYLVHLAKKMIE